MTLLLFINILLLAKISLGTPSTQSTGPKCLLFNFGDSNTDTGGSNAAFGLIPHAAPGHTPNGRASDGRLYIDFLCNSLGIDSLTPYMDSIDSNFTNGVNFAVGGNTAQPAPGLYFPLSVQVNQFAFFQYKVRERKSKANSPTLTPDMFHNAIFSVDIGQNDLAFSVTGGHKRVVGETIPTALASIESATMLLYKLGARKFVIYNTAPLGCLPSVVVGYKNIGLHCEHDQVGCCTEANEYARTFNDGLSSLVGTLRSQMKEAMLVYVDMYAIKHDLIANPSKYGFQNPLIRCYNDSAPTVCPEPSHSVSWDGIHYSEAANEIVASKVSSGEYSSPLMKFNDLCELVIKE